jgi:ADP-heptose:LPS heptosyltransferase
MNQTALVVIKSMGIGDLCILIANIHAISRSIGGPVVVLAQKNTHASAILRHDPHIKKVIDLDQKGFINVVKKIKPYKIHQTYIFSDSIRLYLISKFSNIKQTFHYKFFSKRGKNFFKTAKEFTEKILNTDINTQSKIHWPKSFIEEAKKKYNITDNAKNYICGISASGPTKRWNINNYIKLFKELNKKHPSKFFLAGGPNDEDLIKRVLDNSIGKNCISFSKMTIAETIPIIAACQHYIGNDTGWGHLASGLGLKSLLLFMDSPPLAYGVYSKNISIIVPQGETIESCGHNTRGKNKISYDEVLTKTLELIN